MKIKIIIRKTNIENITIPSVNKDIDMRTLTYYQLKYEIAQLLRKTGSFFKKLNIHLFI